jgi:hypothetical protein
MWGCSGDNRLNHGSYRLIQLIRNWGEFRNWGKVRNRGKVRKLGGARELGGSREPEGAGEFWKGERWILW